MPSFIARFCSNAIPRRTSLCVQLPQPTAQNVVRQSVPVFVAVEAVGVVLVLGGALVAEPGDGHDADEDAEHADADAEQRELGRRVALVGPAVLVLQERRQPTQSHCPRSAGLIIINQCGRSFASQSYAVGVLDLHLGLAMNQCGRNFEP